MKPDKLPPADTESEACLLGACFSRDRNSEHADFDLDAIRSIVSAEMFYTPQYGQVYQAIIDAVDAGEPIDPAAIIPRLNTAAPEEWGETIRGITAQGDPANTGFYARQVREAWSKREIVRQCEKTIERACDPKPDVEAAVIADELMDKLHVATAGSQAVSGPVFRCYSQIERRTLEWEWRRRIVRGGLSLVAGIGGLGKSYLCVDIASRLSAGRSYPGTWNEPNPPGNVIIVSCEDDPETTIAGRLDLCNADSSRVIQFDGVRRSGAKGTVAMFDLSRDLRHLEKVLDARPQTRLVIIDPLAGHLGKETDSHRDADVRSALTPLVAMAARRSLAVVGIVHLGKSHVPGTAAMNRILGSVGFANQARVIWMVFKDPQTPGRRLLLPAKNNLAPMDAGGLAFRITDAGLEWEAEPVQMTADEMVGPVRARLPIDEVCDWLRDYLREGPRSVKYAEAEADRLGFRERTVRRARKQLRVVVSRTQNTWTLPPQQEGGHKGHEGRTAK